MPYKILEHTADVRVLVQSNSIEELFSDSLKAMVKILKPNIAVNKKEAKRTVAVESPDQTALLIDFLNEVLLAAYTHKEAYDKVIFKKFAANSLEAVLHGSVAESFREDIKAVTYHEAEIKKDESGNWRTYLVFDV
ncbi:MAG: archease [Patescibacteria group bacterium]